TGIDLHEQDFQILATLHQDREALVVPHLEEGVHHGLEEMKGLTPHEGEGLHRLQKEDRGHRHPVAHRQIRELVQERLILRRPGRNRRMRDRKSTRLNSSHEWISYAVFCLKKKNKKDNDT